MQKFKYEGKDLEKLLKEAATDLNIDQKELIIIDQSEKDGFLRGKKYTIEVIKEEDILEFIKKYLNEVVSLIGIEANIEVKKSEDKIRITLITNNNALLIGKDGKNLQALEYLLNQTLYTNFQYRKRISLDVGEYKQKKQKILEMKAIKIAKKVITTKKTIKLEPMNAYERRIIHTKLVEYAVDTTSEGDEPNRYIVISSKEK